METVKGFSLVLAGIILVIVVLTFVALHFIDRSRRLRRLTRRSKRAHLRADDDSYRPLNPELAYQLGLKPAEDSRNSEESPTSQSSSS